MSHYGVRIRNKNHVLQIDDRYRNLGLAQTRHVDFAATDLAAPYSNDGPFSPAIQGYPLIHSDYVSVNAGSGPHVVAVMPVTQNALFFVEPDGRAAGGDYTYKISALGTASASCRYFVFSVPDQRAEAYDFRINAGQGTAFLASTAYMRVAKVVNIDAGADGKTFGLPDSGRDYALANTVFSMVNDSVYYDCRLVDATIQHPPDNYLVSRQTISRVRGVGQKDAGTAIVAADHTPLIAGGVRGSSALQASSIIVIDVTDLY